MHGGSEAAGKNRKLGGAHVVDSGFGGVGVAIWRLCFACIETKWCILKLRDLV